MLLWDSVQGEQCAVLEGHGGAVSAVLELQSLRLLSGVGYDVYVIVTDGAMSVCDSNR